MENRELYIKVNTKKIL